MFAYPTVRATYIELMNQQRLPIPDLLKGIAVLLMIQVHLTELFVQESFYHSFTGKVSLFLGGVPAAPLFMVVMGFFAGYQTIGFRSSILRGMKLIALGLVLNIGLNLHLFYKIFRGLYDLDPLPYLLGADILFLAGLSLVIIALLKKAGKGSAWLFFITSFIVSGLSDIIPLYTGESSVVRYALAFIHSSDWWSYFPLLPWLAYSLMGVAAGLLYKKQSVNVLSIIKRPGLAVITLVPLLVFIEYGFGISSDLPEYYHHGIAFFGWAIVFLMSIVLWSFYLISADTKTNYVLRYLLWTGKNVTVFYVIQWLLIGNIATAIYRTQSPASLLVWYPGIVICTSLLVLGWNYRKVVMKLFSQPAG